MLEFDEATHTYAIDGKKVPSVTQCLQLLTDFRNVRPEVLEAAADFGRKGHRGMALMVREQLDWASLDEALVPYLRGGHKFLMDFIDHTPIMSEEMLSDPVLGVAGTLDLVTQCSATGARRGSIRLTEFKFTSELPETAGPQTAAYERLMKKKHPWMRDYSIRRQCVVLTPDAYRIWHLNDPADWADFLSCLNVTKRRIRLGIK